MPQGDKSSYTSKQKRQAGHIEDSEKARGRSRKAAERIAWATVNKQDGGGKKKRAGRPSRTRAGQRSAGRPRRISRITGRSSRSARSRSGRSRTVRSRA